MSFYDELQAGDWLNRTGAHFTQRTGVSQWEQRVTKGQPYSYAFYKPARRVPLNMRFLQCRQQCEGVISAMKLPGQRINLRFGKKNMTDSQTFIELSPEPLGEASGVKGFGHAMDVMLGITVHEMSHVLHTDMQELITATVGMSRGEAGFYGWIVNLVEDERIERLTGRNYAGYMLFVGQTKFYIFDVKHQEMMQELAAKQANGEVPAAAEPLNEIMQQLLYMIRYPKSLDEPLVTKHEQLLRDCQTLLMPYPETPAEVTTAGRGIFDLLKVHYKDLGDNDLRFKLPDNLTMGEWLGQLAKIMMGLFGEFDPTQNHDKIPAGENAGEIIKVMQAINKMKPEDMAERSDEAESLRIDENMQTGHVGVQFRDKSKKIPTHAKLEYQRSLQRVGTFAASLRAEMQQFNRRTAERVSGLDEGTLNVDELVDARLGSKNVFEQMQKTRNNGATIGLLIDESGSMSGTKIERAIDIAVLFERALTGLIGIDYYCYGHTTGADYKTGSSGYGDDTSTIINTYFEGYKKGQAGCMGQMTADSANRDGHALLQVAGRMRKQTQQPIVLFMVSDGAPSASAPQPWTPVTYTREAATKLKSKNIHVIHVAIEAGVQSEDMFTDYVKFTNMATLAKELGKVLKRVVTKIQQPVITIE